MALQWLNFAFNRAKFQLLAWFKAWIWAFFCGNRTSYNVSSCNYTTYVTLAKLFLHFPSQKIARFIALFKGHFLPKALTLIKSYSYILLITFFFSCQPALAEIASFYGNGEKLNKHTANGEVFDPEKYTCATYAYPFNSILKVTNLKNKKSVIVRVNDRGPNKRLGRDVDLSKRAFQKIANLKEGLIEVEIKKIGNGEYASY